MQLCSHRTVVVIALSVLFAVASTGLPAGGADAKSQARAQIESLQQSLKTKPLTDPNFKDLGSRVGALLSEARAELNAGRFYSSLEKLGQAQDMLYGAWAFQDKAETVKSGLPAFESEWGQASIRHTALDAQAGERDWSKAPAALRALSEAAQGKVIPLLDGSRGFATSTQPLNGLFYLGQAEGEAEYATFAYTLRVPNKAAAVALRSYVPEIYALQQKTNAAFVPPRSIELHSRFIGLNSALKLAGELDARKFYAGALYQYLDAVRHYALLDAAAPDAAAQARLKDAISKKLKDVDKARRDDSLARLFLERAQWHIARADGSVPTPDDWRSAQAITDRVLPAYFEALQAAPALEQARGRTIDITLVRWPYT